MFREDIPLKSKVFITLFVAWISIISFFALFNFNHNVTDEAESHRQDIEIQKLKDEIKELNPCGQAPSN